MKKFAILSLGIIFAVIISANARDPSLNSLKDSTKRIMKTTKAERAYLLEYDYLEKASWKEFKKKNNLPRGMRYSEYLYYCCGFHKYFVRPDNVRKKFRKFASN